MMKMTLNTANVHLHAIWVAVRPALFKIALLPLRTIIILYAFFTVVLTDEEYDDSENSEDDEPLRSKTPPTFSEWNDDVRPSSNADGGTNVNANNVESSTLNNANAGQPTTAAIEEANVVSKKAISKEDEDEDEYEDEDDESQGSKDGGPTQSQRSDISFGSDSSLPLEAAHESTQQFKENHLSFSQGMEVLQSNGEDKLKKAAKENMEENRQNKIHAALQGLEKESAKKNNDGIPSYLDRIHEVGLENCMEAEGFYQKNGQRLQVIPPHGSKDKGEKSSAKRKANENEGGQDRKKEKKQEGNSAVEMEKNAAVASISGEGGEGGNQQRGSGEKGGSSGGNGGSKVRSGVSGGSVVVSGGNSAKSGGSGGRSEGSGGGNGETVKGKAGSGSSSKSGNGGKVGGKGVDEAHQKSLFAGLYEKEKGNDKPKNQQSTSTPTPTATQRNAYLARFEKQKEAPKVFEDYGFGAAMAQVPQVLKPGKEGKKKTIEGKRTQYVPSCMRGKICSLCFRLFLGRKLNNEILKPSPCQHLRTGSCDAVKRNFAKIILKLKCTKCDRKFNRNKLLVEEIEEHFFQENHEFICDHCDTKLPFRQLFNHMIEKCHKTFVDKKCTKCKISYQSVGIFYNHLKNVHNIKTFNFSIFNRFLDVSTQNREFNLLALMFHHNDL